MSDLIFDPGYYCKFRIDDQGNIVDTGELVADDLPSHTHSISDLDSSELKSFIASILATFFANNSSSAVVFDYDETTQTVSADLNIDDETVTKNEYGQIVSTSTSTSGSTDVTSDDLDDIKDSISTLENSIPDLITTQIQKLFVNNTNSAVVFDWDSTTSTFTADVRYDGLTISKDENGDLVSSGGDNTSTPSCASHTHTTDDIEDFNTAVVNIFNEYSQTLNIDLTDKIDGVTIKMNSSGQLTAVATALEKHTHTLSEITDYVAPTAAAWQMINALGEDVDYSSGVIDFTNLNIGYGILALSAYIKNKVVTELTSLSEKIEKLKSSGVSNSSTSALLTIDADSLHNTVYDRLNEEFVEVYYTGTFKILLDYLPIKSGKVSVILNGDIKQTTDVSTLDTVGSTDGIITVTGTTVRNSVTVKLLSLDIGSILGKSEKQITVQLKFSSDDTTDYTNKITAHVTYMKEIPINFTDVTKTHTTFGDTEYYDKPTTYTYQLDLESYTERRYVNLESGFDSATGVLVSTALESTYVRAIQNLFSTTRITMNFEKETESSSSDMYTYCTSSTASFVNDKLIGPGVAEFVIPASARFNALKITNLNEYISYITVTKGDLSFDLNSSDYAIALNDTTMLATELDTYDSGTSNFLITITVPENVKIDLSNVKIEPCDWNY